MTKKEKLIQECVLHFSKKYLDKIILAMPCGVILSGSKDVNLISDLQKAGLLHGCPELFIPHANNYHGVWFKFIEYGETLTKEALSIIAVLMFEGYKVYTVANLTAFKNKLKEYMGAK
ncbi:MAG: hypothetical protein KBA02_00195 [Paludibacteraceae bacterium]|nr:hypothetical protein [Paludibacteraceae bacterium]